MEKKSIMIVTGEASGELYVSRILREIKKIRQDLHIFGMGGDMMEKEGFENIASYHMISIIGIMEVFKKLPTILKIFFTLRNALVKRKPSLIVLVDFPDFNLRLGRVAKRLGIPVLYFISPQIWAWRTGRIKKIKEIVDRMIVILPFEVPFYRNHGVEVFYCGHPLIEIIEERQRRDILQDLSLRGSGTIIALFPGSRDGEIKNILPEMLRAAKIISEAINDAVFLMPVASGRVSLELRGNNDINIKLLPKSYAHDLLSVSDIAIIASGTATLEAAILGVPMVIVYRFPDYFYRIGIRIFRMNVKDYGLVNLIAGRRIIPELIQFDCTGEKIAHEVLRILKNADIYNKIKNDLSEVKKKLGDRGATERIAKLILEMV